MQEPLIDQVTIHMELDLQNEEIRDSIMKSLIADNINFPRGLEMEMHSVSENMLVVIFDSHFSIETIANTVDEILSHISIGYMVLEDD
jgi:hypothetical protein